MKLTKKNMRRLLKEVIAAAKDLHLCSSNLSLLSNIEMLANKAMQHAEGLLNQLEDIKREQLHELIENAEALQILEEIVDTDIISELEDQLFTATDSLEHGKLSEFFTQMMEKLEILHIRLLEAVQRLNALQDEDD